MEELGITIQFQGETLQFDKSVDGMNKAIKTLKKEVSLFNSQLKFNPQNIDALVGKMANLKQQEQLAKKVLQEYVKELSKIDPHNKEEREHWNNTLKHIAEANKDIIDIQRQMQKMDDEMNGIVDKTELWHNRLQKVSKTAGEVADVFDPISRGSQKLLQNIAQSAIDFESAFADVKKTVNTTDFYDEDYLFSVLAKDAKDLSTYLPKSASEIATLMGLAGQMNVPANQIKDFTEAMIKFGDSTNITAEEAITDIAQIYNVIGKGGNFDDLNQLLSTIVELGNNSATTEKDITTMFKNISAGASRVKMTEAQMVALSATLSSLGLDKGGASAISKIMTNIDMAVTKSGADMQEWAKIAGMSGEKFKKAWAKDSADVLLRIVTSMSQMTDEGISMNKILSDLDIKELRQVDTLSRLVQAHDEYAKNINLANKAYEEGTALTEEARKRYETLASQIEITKNNFELFALSLGETLIPYIRDLLDRLMELADWLNGLDPEVQQMLVYGASALAIVSPLARGIQKISTGIELLWKWCSTLFTTVIFFVKGALFEILKLCVTHPILMAITALIAVIVILYNNFDSVKQIIDELIKGLKDWWEEVKKTDYIDTLGEHFGLFGEAIGVVVEAFKVLIEIIGAVISKVNELIETWGGLGEMFNGAGFMLGSKIRGWFTGGGSVPTLNNGNYTVNSGGFNSSGVTLNANFSVNSNNITRSDVRAWSEWMADDINDILGRKIR